MWTIDDCFALRLKKISEDMMRYYTEVMAPCGVTPSQYIIIYRIQELEGASMKEVADALHLDKSTLARTVKPLEKKGLIYNQARPNSRRYQLAVTEEGRKVLREGGQLWQGAQQHIADLLGEQGIQDYNALLTVLKNEKMID